MNSDLTLQRTYFSEDTLLPLGLIFLSASQDFLFVFGGVGRFLSLFLGVTLISLSALMRISSQRADVSKVVFISFGYFVVLALISWFMGHAIMSRGVMSLLYPVIVFVLFLSGVLLSTGKSRPAGDPNVWLFRVVSILVLYGLYKFFGYLKTISYHSVTRGYGDAELNPVSVAFNHANCALVYAVYAMNAKNVINKMISLIVVLFCYYIVMSSASRGAFMYMSVSLVLAGILSRKRIDFSRNKFIYGVFLLFLGIVAVYIYKTNYGVSERIALLFERFGGIFGLSDTEYIDRSSQGRVSTVEGYLNNVSSWLILGERGYDEYPHNQFLEYLVRFGIAGIPLLVLSILACLGVSKIVLRKGVIYDKELIFVITLFVFGFLQSMTSLSLEMNRIMWLGYGYLLGFYLIKFNASQKL